MIYKGSYLIPADRCGVFLTKVFHLYWGGSSLVSNCGEFVKVSAKRVSPSNKVKKKKKLVGVLIRLQKEFYKNDSSFTIFGENSVILVKKRWAPKGKEVSGPVCWMIRKRKFSNSFSGII